MPFELSRPEIWGSRPLVLLDREEDRYGFAPARELNLDPHLHFIENPGKRFARISNGEAFGD